MSKKLFVIGTGTDIGKTYVSSLIVKKLKESGVSTAYYKASMSGNNRGADGNLLPGDALYVKEVSGISQSLKDMCPYVYENAVSPHLASRIEGNSVKMKVVFEGFQKLCSNYEYITIEGSGGILCPISFDESEVWLSDIIRKFNASCLLIADAGLGTINNVGLTAFYMKENNIPLKGIIFNNYKPGDIMQEDNIKMCEHLTGTKVIACVQRGDRKLNISTEALKALYE